NGDEMPNKDEPLQEEEINDIGSDSVEDDLIEHDGGEEEKTDISGITPKNSAETTVMVKRRRSCRKVPGNVKYTESSEESDGEVEPTLKKNKSEPVERRDKYGIFLLCSCGTRYSSDHDQKKHDKKCTGHEFTLHKLDEVTLQCVLCEIHPKTLRGYSAHLRIHHKSTLIKNGVYLQCSCGVRYNTDNADSKHGK
ncbi:hypothetical protein PMAYCL1PPCAC_14297, partial [Pristionchus mayeri]